VRQRHIETSPEVKRVAPILCEAVRHVGHRQTRNRGTLGGSLCHLDPAAELPAMALLYGATVHVAGAGGTKMVPMADFMEDYMTPSLAPDEIVTAVDFPIWPVGHGCGFHEFARRHGDFAIAAAGCLMECDAQNHISRVAIAVAGVEATPTRLAEAELSLHGQPAIEDTFKKAAEHCLVLKAIGDVHGSADYRRKVASSMVRRSLAVAAERARKGKGR